MKKYSPEDQKKILADTLGELKVRGADTQEGTIVHPGGFNEGIRQIQQDKNRVVDQSLEQTQRNRENMKRR